MRADIRFSVAVLIPALIVVAACSRSHTYSTKEGSVTVDNKGKDAASMTFTGKDGQKVTVDVNAGKLPADYPKDVPVYKDAKVTMSQVVSEKHGSLLMLETGDAMDKVTDFYKKELESNGWKIESTTTTGDAAIIGAKKENRALALQISNSGDKRNIMQTVSEQ